MNHHTKPEMGVWDSYERPKRRKLWPVLLAGAILAVAAGYILALIGGVL